MAVGMLVAWCSAAQAQTTSAADFEVDPGDSSLVRYNGPGRATIGEDLVFQRCAFGMTWNAAQSACTGSANTYASVSDAQADVDAANTTAGLVNENAWRIANINELRLMVPTPAGAAPTAYAVFPNTPQAKFWTDTKFSISSTQDTGSFLLDFATGATSVSETAGRHVRLVKGYAPNTTFDFQVVPSDHNLVIDVGRDGQANNTGRIFQRCTFGMNWDEASQQCTGTPTAFSSYSDAATAVNAFNTAGGLSGITQWRMADINELGSTKPASNFPPVTAPFIHYEFPNTPAEAFWSNTIFLAWNFIENFSVRGSSPTTGIGKHVRLVYGGNDLITISVVPGPHGSVDNSQQQTPKPGSMFFVAQPDVGYQVDGVPVGDACNVSLAPPLTNPNAFQVSGAPANCTVRLSFKRIPNLWFVSATTVPANNAGGQLLCDATAATNTSAACTATPDPGFKTRSIEGCRGNPTGEGVNSYTTGSVIADCTVTATFAPTYVFTLPATTGGAITCKKTADNAPVINGDTLMQGTAVTCEAAPATGYALTGWGGDCANAGTAAQCDITAVTGATTISAQFTKQHLLHIATTADGGIACANTQTNLPIADGGMILDGSPVQCIANAASGKIFTGWGADCAGANASTSGNSCTFASVNADTTVSATFVQAIKSFTGTTQPAQGPGGSATASFTGGGAACRFDTSGSVTGFVPAPGTSPAGKTLPQGMFRFKLIGCDNTPVTVRIDWPAPVDGLIKYGLAAQGDSGSTFFLPNGVQVSGHTTQFVVTDGQKGDDDWTENGEIVDPVAAVTNAAPQPVSHPVPTLGQAALLALGLLAGLSGMAALRRQRT